MVMGFGANTLNLYGRNNLESNIQAWIYMVVGPLWCTARREGDVFSRKVQMCTIGLPLLSSSEIKTLDDVNGLWKSPGNRQINEP